MSLINDVLDLSKIEAGKMELHLETFDVPALVEEVATTVQPLVEKNANRLELRCAPDVGSMHADLTKVRQMLLNLLSNACKFTERGTITVSIERERDGPGRITSYNVCYTKLLRTMPGMLLSRSWHASTRARQAAGESSSRVK